MSYDNEKTIIIGGEAPHTIHGGIIFEIPLTSTVHRNDKDKY